MYLGNGNLIKDLNKNISNIGYNLLSLFGQSDAPTCSDIKNKRGCVSTSFINLYLQRIGLLLSLPLPESQYTPFPPEPQKEFLQDQTHPFRPSWLLSRYTQR